MSDQPIHITVNKIIDTDKPGKPHKISPDIIVIADIKNARPFHNSWGIEKCIKITMEDGKDVLVEEDIHSFAARLGAVPLPSVHVGPGR